MAHATIKKITKLHGFAAAAAVSQLYEVSTMSQTTSSSKEEIKIGNLVQLNLEKFGTGFLEGYQKFNGFLGIVIDVTYLKTLANVRIYGKEPKIFRISWCSLKLRVYDREPTWNEDHLEVVQ